MSDRLVLHFRAMARNNAWANDRLLEACEALVPAEFAAPRTGSFPSLRATLNHILAVGVYYLDALEETDRGLAAFDPKPDITEPAALRAAQSASDRRPIAFCDRLTEPRLDRRVVTARDGDRPTERPDAFLAHRFQHQIHHRGHTRCSPAPPCRCPSWTRSASTGTATRPSQRAAICHEAHLGSTIPSPPR